MALGRNSKVVDIRPQQDAAKPISQVWVEAERLARDGEAALREAGRHYEEVARREPQNRQRSLDPKEDFRKAGWAFERGGAYLRATLAYINAGELHDAKRVAGLAAEELIADRIGPSLADRIRHARRALRDLARSEDRSGLEADSLDIIRGHSEELDSMHRFIEARR
ncbi:MAG: hypothetical protein KGH72_02210 [Candidatus Micrarchaeota archaeon]|nr:hypothetical protein [Candidatus Micrarchaeota archaeon]